MIRRFIHLSVFLTTITTASFGQNIVGRDNIEAWAKKFQHEAPARGKEALEKTDIFLAHLSPQAGSAPLQLCDVKNPLG